MRLRFARTRMSAGGRSCAVAHCLLEPRDLDVEQVWFAGSHADIGGGPRLDLAGPPAGGKLLSDHPLGTHRRPIDHGQGPVRIYESVRRRWNALNYRPIELNRYLLSQGGWSKVSVVEPGGLGLARSVAE